MENHSNIPVLPSEEIINNFNNNVIIDNAFKAILDAANVVDSMCQFGNDSSDDESEDEVVQNTLCIVADTPIRTHNFIERVVNKYTRKEFQQNFRMEIEVYEFLLAEVSRAYKDTYKKDSTLPIDNQLLCTIWILANRESYRSVADRFGIAKSTLSWCFFRVIEILNKLAPSFIKWPNTGEMARIQTSFSKHKVRGVVGVIDGTYCPISVPTFQSHCYTNRKKFTSVTLQAICDDKMKFTDCFVGYPSSVHDARIFTNSPIYDRANAEVDKYFPNSSKILADKAYPCLAWCIPPYKDCGRLTNRQKRFNQAHASTRQIIERSFALLFGRFRRLHHLKMKRMEKIPSKILAACVLHNVCLEFPEDMEATDSYVVNGSEDAIRNTPHHTQSNNDRSNEGIAERDRMADEV